MGVTVGLGRAATAEAVGSRPQGASDSKLAKSAREFEAILLQSWLEKINQSFVGSGESQDAAHDTVSSLGTQAISTALAARGGIGIGRMILRQLEPKETTPETAGTAEKSQGLIVRSGSADL